MRCTRLALLLVVAAPLYAAVPAAAQCYPGLPCADDAPAAPREDVPAADNQAEAPEPTQTEQTCYVDDVRKPDDWLALRTEPSSKAGRQLRRLRKGQQFVLTGDFRGQWYQVRLPDGMEGWVSWQMQRWIAC